MILIYLKKKTAMLTNDEMAAIKSKTFDTMAQILRHGAQKRKHNAIRPLKKAIPRNAITA